MWEVSVLPHGGRFLNSVCIFCPRKSLIYVGYLINEVFIAILCIMFRPQCPRRWRLSSGKTLNMRRLDNYEERSLASY